MSIIVYFLTVGFSLSAVYLMSFSFPSVMLISTTVKLVLNILLHFSITCHDESHNSMCVPYMYIYRYIIFMYSCVTAL